MFDPLGQTGLGKSTLINTIFASHLIDTKGRFEPDEPVRQTTEIQAVSHSESLWVEEKRCCWMVVVSEGEEDGKGVPEISTDARLLQRTVGRRGGGKGADRPGGSEAPS